MPIFSLILAALAALVLYSSIQQLYVAIRKHGSPLHLTFSLASLAIVGTVIGNIILVNSDSVKGLIDATRIRIIFVALSTAILPWFTSYYSGFRPRLFMIAYSALTMIFLAVRLTHPLFLTYSAFLDPGTMTLPWNETIAVFNAHSNSWQVVYYVIGLTSLAFMYVSAAYQFSRGERGRAVALAASVTLLLGFIINDVVLVLNDIQWILLGDFGWLAMIILLGFSLTEDIVKAGEIKQSLVESEQTLRISEGKYRLLADNVMDVIWTMDMAMNVTYITPSAEKVFGWSLEDWHSMRPEQYLPPISFAVIRDTLLDEINLATGADYDRKRVITMEVEQYRRNGTTFWTEISSRFMWDGSGRPNGIIGVTRDISDRKAAEAALVHQNRALMELNRLGIGLASLSSDESIHSYLARELKSITGATVVIVTAYDPARKQLQMEHLELDETFPLTAENARMIDLYVKIIPVNDEAYSRIMSETVANRSTLNELTFGAIPEEISRQITSTFGFDRYIGIAYIYKGTLYGTSALALKKGLPAPSEELLLSFAYLAAVSLRRNRAEEQLRNSLEEKNVLIKEVHHRVKNNLQVIISLLNLQADRISDPGALSLQNESITRLHSMALIHESIYQSDNFVDINMEPYVKVLVSLLLRTFTVDERALHITISIIDVSLNVNRAVPCALLLNELITNVLKHGIRKDIGSGQMIISFMRAGDAYRLVVEDRGPGMDSDIFNAPVHKTLGLQLIKALVQQLGGTVALAVNNGCRFTIEFPAADEEVKS